LAISAEKAQFIKINALMMDYLHATLKLNAQQEQKFHIVNLEEAP